MSRVRLLELLGLHASATRDEIKSRYRELARKFHPDVNAGDERAHARFRAIVAAYQELVAGEADGVDQSEWATHTPPTVETERSGDLDGGIASPTRTSSPESSSGDLARQRAELRVRLDQRKATMRRTQADVRDGDAKAFTARRRGDDQTARHFERRVEADRSRVYALLGEISGLERELQGLEAGVAGGDDKSRTTSESGLDPADRLNREVQKVHDEELAALKMKHENNGRRR